MNSKRCIRRTVLLAVVVQLILAACRQDEPVRQRPREPWIFRSVLDRKPRMVTMALDSECYVAYDLSRCLLYKVWKGGVLMEGAAYTDKKNVQPLSWGTSYVSDTLRHFTWQVRGAADTATIRSRGYVVRDNTVTLLYAMVLSSGDTVRIEERPEVRREDGEMIFERSFKTSNVPDDVEISLGSGKQRLTLKPNGTMLHVTRLRSLPAQRPPAQEQQYDHRGRYFIEKSDCLTCHEFDRKTVGPSFLQIAERYRDQEGAVKTLSGKVRDGGSGNWGQVAMNPHPQLAEAEIKNMVDYILSLNSAGSNTSPALEPPSLPAGTRPGFGAPLAGVHPSYDLSSARPSGFRPRVGGLAFLPDGRLLVTTWDSIGGVYVLGNLQARNPDEITVKRIASGLAEPLGIAVVNGGIFVLQKQELTQLIDLDGDEVTDEYRTICNSWGVTDDFHEFSFGLIYRDGYFYATLSLAMRLMSGERQQFDRGRTIRIAMDGSYEWINYGLRTPNGIGIGPDGELFVTDNQGEWIPANKLIHVRPGDYHGMRWGLPESVAPVPATAPPVIWLPEDEIGNSPSQPVLMQDGPYKGQMLHGDVTHGGIKRDYIEKVGGAYQGAVFRFTQGLEAGINRLCWGPDGALYAGGIGMVGGWSWKEKQFGLQRLKYNGKVTFEMLAVRARANGFEIEFTEPLAANAPAASEIAVQQWWYLPTEDYGGPKMDLESLTIRTLSMSEDRRRMILEIPGLKKGRVVYFRLPDNLRSASGQMLWSSESWYTLNNIPER